MIARAAYRAETEAARRLVASAGERVTILRAQAQSGRVAPAAVLAGESTLAAAEAVVPSLEQRAAAADHLLTALVGRAPGEWAAPEAALESFALPVPLPLTLPSTLVRERPDVALAEARLHRATAGIGVATAELLPSLTLSGALGNDALAWSALRDPAGRFWSATAGLDVPLYQGGAAWHGRAAAIAARDAALENYRGAVLEAFREVADVLGALEQDALALAAAGRGLRALEDASALAAVGERAGTVERLMVLGAQEQAEAARLAWIAARAQQLEDAVALYAALGGGPIAAPR
jgi:NodT family efflux transporter outer membrane factor (OMF) lipoprotein